MPHWVVFDFCETLVNIQTADAFIAYVQQKQPHFLRRLWMHLITLAERLKVFAIAQKLIPRYNLEKRLRLFTLRGLSEETLEHLAQTFNSEVLKHHENHEMMQRLLQHQEAGDFVQLSSGGLHIYLNYWAQEHQIRTIHATQLKFKNGICTGFILGKDCMFEEKVQRLNQEPQGLPTIAYSDSITDLPLLKWAQTAYVISYQKPQHWVASHPFNEFILSRKS
jgi:HAD superfamily hydrolase (TIGR01490 family)